MSRNFSAVIERDPNGHSQREEGGLRDYPEGVEYQSPGSRSAPRVTRPAPRPYPEGVA